MMSSKFNREPPSTVEVLTTEDGSFKPYHGSFAPANKLINLGLNISSFSLGFYLGYASVTGIIPSVNKEIPAEVSLALLRCYAEAALKINATLEEQLLAEIEGQDGRKLLLDEILLEDRESSRLKPRLSRVSYTLLKIASAGGSGFFNGGMKQSFFGGIGYGVGIAAAYLANLA